MEQAHPIAIGKYEILSVIGRGGMGVVYRAQNRLMGMQVAIKTVTEGLSTDGTAMKRFYEEAEKMGMLKHPNIIQVFDLGEQDGFPYIVMEYVEGDPLDRIIASEKPASLIFKLRIIEQVCAALSYAHQSSPPVVHRDVKPANVIVRPDGVAKLLDFGIARQEKRNTDLGLTEPGGVIGTVPYMAPERLRGAALDGRSDIFATGVLLFQFLTGRLPFLGSEYILVNQLLNEKHPPLRDFLEDYPEALDGILDRALAKEPGDRYQTADEMAADLYSVIESLKQDYSAHLLLQAERLAAAGDLSAARESIFQLMKLDNKNIHARKMLSDLNTRIARQAGAEQSREKVRLAEDALRDKNTDRAIQLFDEALKLTPDDSALSTRLEFARAQKQTNDQILNYLRQAELAKSAGDFTGARAIVEKAIQLDTGNSRLRQALNSLVRQAEEAAQIARVKTLVDSARSALANRDFLGVLALVKQVELLDPSHIDLSDLVRSAQTGLEHEQRRKLFAEIEEQLAGSLTEEDTRRVAAQIAQSLDQTPSDPTLLRYRAQVDRRLRDFDLRRLIDSTVLQARALIDTSPIDALDLVRKALLEVPGDLPESERLLALESTLQERIARLSAEETRNAILLRARDALNNRQFSDAVRILDQCQGHLRTPEIDQLLEFARQESRDEQHRQLIATSYAQAQTLLREDRLPELVALLTPVLASSPTEDPRLRALLNQAQATLAERTAALTAAFAILQPLAAKACHEQLLTTVQSLPPTLRSDPKIQSFATAAQLAWQQEWTHLESFGRAYAALATPDLSADVLAAPTPTPTDTPIPAGVLRRLTIHRTAAADLLLTAQIDRIQAAKSTNAVLDPAVSIPAKKLLPFASEPIAAAFTALADHTTGGRRMDKLLGKLGRRRP